MTRVRVCLFLTCVAATTGSAYAQTVQDRQWTVSAEFLNVWTRGNDVHPGDVFTEHQTLSGTASASRLDYGVTFEPILTTMGDDQSAIVSAAYRGRRWQFGGRWWRAIGEGNVSGSRSTTPPTASAQFITGIRMWENSLLPVDNQQDPSGISPVTFHAENRLENTVIDGYAALPLISGSSFNLAARFGGAYARVENTRSEGNTQRAFVVQTSGANTTTLTNNITLDSESETTANLLGPTLALAGDTTVKRVKVSWLVGHSLLLGTAKTSGGWIDIDNINQVTVASGIRTETSTVLDGEIPVELDEHAVVPVVELQVRGSVRVTKLVSVGGGLFSSTWFNMPLAPGFVVPDDWTDVQGTGWRSQSRTVTFTGFSIFAELDF